MAPLSPANMLTTSQLPAECFDSHHGDVDRVPRSNTGNRSGWRCCLHETVIPGEQSGGIAGIIGIVGRHPAQAGFYAVAVVQPLCPAFKCRRTAPRLFESIALNNLKKVSWLGPRCCAEGLPPGNLPVFLNLSASCSRLEREMPWPLRNRYR